MTIRVRTSRQQFCHRCLLLAQHQALLLLKVTCRSAHPTENKSGLTAQVFMAIPMEVGTLVNSETTKEVDRVRSRLPTETDMSANGAMARKMDKALTHLLAVTNTSAIGRIAKETGGV